MYHVSQHSVAYSDKRTNNHKANNINKHKANKPFYWKSHFRKEGFSRHGGLLDYHKLRLGCYSQRTLELQLVQSESAGSRADQLHYNSKLALTSHFGACIKIYTVCISCHFMLEFRMIVINRWRKVKQNNLLEVSVSNPIIENYSHFIFRLSTKY